MHAKMTRDRKKSFISNIEETIEQLETNNDRMKDVLKDVVQTHFNQQAGHPSPASVGVSVIPVPSATSTRDTTGTEGGGAGGITPPLSVETTSQPAKKRVRHGFSLTAAG